MWHRLLLYLGVALAIQWPASAVAATPDDDAAVERFNARVDEAIRLRDGGDRPGALEAFDGALEAIKDRSGPVFDKGRSVVRYHEAQLLVALDRYEEARAMLTLLLRSPGLDPGERETVAERLAEVEAKLAEQRAAARPARLRITAAGVEDGVPVDVRVDGVAVGRAPVVVERPAGRYRVDLGADGFRPATDEVLLEPGADVTRTIHLEPVARRDTTVAGWTTLGAGVLLLGGATALYVEAEDTLDQATVEGLPYPTAVERRTAGQNEAVGSYVMYAVGSMAVVTGLLLVLLDGEADEPVPPSEGATVSVGPGAVIVGGRF